MVENVLVTFEGASEESRRELLAKCAQWLGLEKTAGGEILARVGDLLRGVREAPAGDRVKLIDQALKELPAAAEPADTAA